MLPLSDRGSTSASSSEWPGEWRGLAQKMVAYPRDFGMRRRDVEPLVKKLAQQRERQENE